MDFDELPDMLTVEEMARAFRLGRSQAYELTRQVRPDRRARDCSCSVT